MNVGFSIPIHEESKQYIEETLSRYTEVYEMKHIENPIIHMYAKEDTLNEDGELNGYNDSLFFECHLYDTKKMEVYKTGNKDSLWFGEGVQPSNVKLFKDGSTLVHLRNGKYKVGYYTSLYLELI